MTESLNATEALGAKGATHPRITLDYIKGQIDHQWTFRLNDMLPDSLHATSIAHEKLAHVTVCTLVLRSGFVVIGKSAPMSPANFDREKGAIFAYEDAIRQLWPLFAFAQLQNAPTERDLERALGVVDLYSKGKM